VVEVGDGAVEPEVNGGDGGVGEVGERGLDALARCGVFGERGEETCGLLEGEGEEEGGCVVAVAVGRGDLPEAAGEALDMVDAGARMEGSSLLCGEVRDRGVEVG